jgi:hypothetical protein
MKQFDTSALREATIRYWANFVHARAAQDVQRVHAFQTLARDNEDLAAVTDDQITEAYGGRGWAPAPACYECGARSDANVAFGAQHDISLCPVCISMADAYDAYTPPETTAAPPTPGFFTRLFRKGA